MRKILLLIFCFLICSLNVQALELILPKEKKSITDTQYALFVGKTSGGESLSINDEYVYVAPNGAFAHSIKLKDGNNRIMVRSTYGSEIFKIYKTQKAANKDFPIEEFEKTKAIVNCNNTPLRNTPIDAGLNRIGHLFEGTELIINGAKGNFYRVYLSSNEEAWIMKKDVTLCCDSVFYPAEFIDMKNEQFKNATVQSITFSKKIPYSIEDKDKEIIFKVYNPEMSDNSVYTLNIPKPKKYIYNVTLVDGKYTFKVKELPKSIKDCTIAIDPGHGGAEKGAIGCLGDEEKDVNLKIALELEKLLKSKDINVVMTRDVDCNIGLNERTDVAKENDAEIFVSIHLNSIGDTPMNIHKIRGTSVYYFNKNSKEFAEILEKTVPKSAGTHRDGVKTASFAVIRPTNYVGVLIETAYMINPMDSMLYRNKNFAKKVAKGIFNGIEQFVNK